MSDFRERIVDFRPAPPGWRIAFLTPSGYRTEALPGWLIQEEIESSDDGEERPTGWRTPIAAMVDGPGLEPVTTSRIFWMILDPLTPDPTLDEAETEQRERAEHEERLRLQKDAEPDGAKARAGTGSTTG